MVGAKRLLATVESPTAQGLRSRVVALSMEQFRKAADALKRVGMVGAKRFL